jgi:hypothetical protein
MANFILPSSKVCAPAVGLRGLFTRAEKAGGELVSGS